MTKKDNARILTGSPSIFLDSLRIGAALTVLYIHAFDRWFPTLAHDANKPGEPSHAAVIIFFVLSGYVIAHTTISKNRGGMQYAQARLTRLSSVVIPALVITAVIQLFIAYIDPQTFLTYTRGGSAIRFILSGLFVNEVWLYSAAPPLNGSLWSLSFEFWYYTIFGFWFFRTPGWKSFALALLTCLIAGPKILVMMPVWLAGYFAYRLPRPVMTVAKAWILIVVLLFIAWIAINYIPAMPYLIGYKPLYYANQFITDWIISIFIAAALWILPSGNNYGADTQWANVLRKIADLTFPLYVLHFPLLILWRCLFGYQLNNTTQLWEAIIAIFVASMLIGVVLEKQRFIWARFFKWLLGGIKADANKNTTSRSA